MNDEPNQLQLRHCSGCHSDVNLFEWKHCTHHFCEADFEGMAIAFDPMRDSFAPGAELILSVDMKRRALMANGMNCPFCGSQSLTVTVIEDRTGIRATREMTCQSNHKWYEVFALSTILTVKEHDAIYLNEESTLPPDEPKEISAPPQDSHD